MKIKNNKLKIIENDVLPDAVGRKTRSASLKLKAQRIPLKTEKDEVKTDEFSPVKVKTNKITSRKRKADAENDINESNTEIQLKKKKKVIELPTELVEKVEVLKMQNLMKTFGGGSVKDFHSHCIKIMTHHKDLIKVAHDLTIEQADTEIWHQLRIGRVTASRLHETTRCTMVRGSLVDKFMGKRSGWSFAMMRGTVLEEFVFEEVRKEFPELQRSGFMMNHEVPFFSASPDGLHTDFVLEIKCPGTANTFAQYIDVDKLSRKYFAQIQLQMLITGRTKALLAVAHLDFETTRNITKVWIPFEREYMDEMMEQATEFYEKAIFPALKKKFFK